MSSYGGGYSGGGGGYSNNYDRNGGYSNGYSYVLGPLLLMHRSSRLAISFVSRFKQVLMRDLIQRL